MTNLLSFSAILNLVGFWDVAIALLVLFIISCLLERFTNKGPMLWPVLGIMPSVFLNVNSMYDWATVALIRAGGTFYFRGMWFGGAHGIITIDPSKLEYMLKTRFNNFPKGQRYRERFHDLLGDGIFNADDQMWKEQRRVATTEMHSSRFVEHSFLSMQVLVHEKLLKLMDDVVNSRNSVIDLQEVLLRFTFDNICTAALGVDPGCLALDFPQIPFAKAFEEATELTLFRFMLPPFVWKPMKRFEMGYEKRLKESVRIVHEFAEKAVTERRNELVRLGGLNDRSDLLSRLMEYTDQNPEGQGTQKRFSNKFLVDFCISFILAGRDTSSVALAWFFWLVQKTPEVENKILKEMNEILGQRRQCSNIKEPAGHDAIFTVEELKNMVYLQAALSESLRLYPAVPIDIKEVVEDDVFPDGTVVKKGGGVLYSMFSMARIESIWGQDCLEFRPERWIKDGVFVSENQFKYPVFNGGPRLCVGKKFAYMQMKMVAAAILLRYEVKVVEGHNVVPKLTTTLYMQNGLLVTLKPRALKSKRLVSDSAYD
ncbi:PREDICTED: cytochrome P450 86B1-like [Prunus mume]|uniref:Cytochrome P450 86B1-like n=1 Tax=Prunus mume TaxID=102107 RepID=A0ABM0NAU2_PRUMU|nr:PREDICTED: cytochrome P450 86B1-like [Prunus mume]